MRYSFVQLRYISLFVLLFLCLNAFGMLCLSFCSPGTSAVDLATPSCHRQTEAGDSGAVKLLASAHEAECCAMPVSLVAAAVEKRVPAVQVSARAIIERIAFQAPYAVWSREANIQVYSPPPLDRSGDRVKHSVIRI